jgi:hypothetical protein
MTSVVIKWSSKRIDAARGVIYDRHMFIVQANELVSVRKSTVLSFPFQKGFLALS